MIYYDIRKLFNFKQNLYSVFSLKGRVRHWPGSKREALITLKYGANYPSLEALLNHNQFSKTLVSNIDIENWTFSEFVWSALLYKLGDPKLPSNRLLSSSVWSVITNFLMNSSISGDIRKNLERNFFYREEDNQARLKGFIYSLDNSLATFFDQNCIENIIIFNRLGDSRDVQKMIQHFNVKKDLKIVTTFLSHSLTPQSHIISKPRPHIIPNHRQYSRLNPRSVEYLIEEKQRIIKTLKVEIDSNILRAQYQCLQEIDKELILARQTFFGAVFKNLPYFVLGFIVVKFIRPSTVDLVPQPAPACMTIEIPAVNMISVTGLRRSFSTSSLGRQADSPRPVLTVSTRAAETHSEDLRAMSSDTDSEGNPASPASVEGRQSGTSSSDNSADFSGSNSFEISKTPRKGTQFVSSSIKLPSSTNRERNESFTEGALSSSTNSSSSKNSSANDRLGEDMQSGSLFSAKQKKENPFKQLADHCRQLVNHFSQESPSTKSEDGTSGTGGANNKIGRKDRKLLNKIDPASYKALQGITEIVEGKSLTRRRSTGSIENPFQFYTTLFDPQSADAIDLQGAGADKSGFSPQNQIPRTPAAGDISSFSPQNQIPRTPAAGDISSFSPQNQIPRTPTAGHLSSSQSIEESTTTGHIPPSQSIEELPESSSTAEARYRENQHRARIFQDEERQLARVAGQGSQVSLNRGEDGKVNNANTNLYNYGTKTAFNKKTREILGKESAPPGVTEFDHLSGKTDHENLEPFGEGYDRGVAQAVPKKAHEARGQARREQADFDRDSLTNDPTDTTLSIANKSTMQDVSIQNQLTDLFVAQNRPQEELDKFGIYRESTLAATSNAHAMDRDKLQEVEAMTGLAGNAHYNCVQVRSADKIAFNTSKDLLRAIVRTLPTSSLEDYRNPDFIRHLYKGLSYIRKAKIFRESVSTLYAPGTVASVTIENSGREVGMSLVHLLEGLKHCDVDISILHRYNPDLEAGGVISFSADSLFVSPCDPAELLTDPYKMDMLAFDLKAREGLQGRPRVLPDLDNIIKTIQTSQKEVNTSSGQQSFSPSIEESAKESNATENFFRDFYSTGKEPLSLTQGESTISPVSEEQSLTAGIESLSLTQGESTISPVSEEQSLTADREILGTTQEESSSIKNSKEESTFSTSRGRGRVQSSSTDSPKSNTKATSLKKASPSDKNSKALTIRTKPGNIG